MLKTPTADAADFGTVMVTVVLVANSMLVVRTAQLTEHRLGHGSNMSKHICWSANVMLILRGVYGLGVGNAWKSWTGLESGTAWDNDITGVHHELKRTQVRFEGMQYFNLS